MTKKTAPHMTGGEHKWEVVFPADHRKPTLIRTIEKLPGAFAGRIIAKIEAGTRDEARLIAAAPDTAARLREVEETLACAETDRDHYRAMWEAMGARATAAEQELAEYKASELKRAREAGASTMLIGRLEAQRDALLRAAQNIMRYHGAYIDALPGERGLSDLKALRTAITSAGGKV